VALLRPKGKSNREHKHYLTRKAILRLLDQFSRPRQPAQAAIDALKEARDAEAASLEGLNELVVKLDG